MPGRKPKPTKLKILLGNPGHRRLNHAEPQSEVVNPDPPECLSKEAKEAWKQIAGWLYESGIMTKLDIPALEVLCTAYGRWRKAEDTVNQIFAANQGVLGGGLMMKSKKDVLIQNPMVGIANRASEIFMKCLVEFGMTPSSRSRIRAEGERGRVDPTEKYFKKKA